jgi:hypothetical protein
MSPEIATKVQVAVHAADGYARQRGKFGHVVTTAGSGCTNAVFRLDAGRFTEAQASGALGAALIKAAA